MDKLDTRTFRHSDRGEWSAEASDLGWAPGYWPEQFEAEILGTVKRFTRVSLDDTRALYAAEGAVFRVWND